MNAPALALAFHDPANSLHGVLRAGVGLLYEGHRAAALAEPPLIEPVGEGARVRAGDELDLRFVPLAGLGALGGGAAAVCSVNGTVARRSVHCLGTSRETAEPLDWGAVDVVRDLSAVWDERTALIAQTRRPLHAPGHGHERAEAWLLADGRLARVDDARISTVYDAHGRQRSAGLELWIEGDEEAGPARAAGVAVAGTSLQLADVRVNAALFAWSMEGREGFGSYEVTLRGTPVAA